MNPRKVIVAGVVILLLAAGGFAAAQTGTGEANEEFQNRTIGVQATADAAAQPDVALVRIAVVAEAPDADAARSRVAANASELRSALQSMGIDDDQVRTTYFHLDVIYEGTGSSRTIVGYRAAHGFEVETDDDRAGAVIDTAVTNGANRVDRVTFTLSDETRRHLRASAIDRAMADARADAEVIAAAGGVSIVDVHSVTTTGVDFVAVEGALVDGSAREGATVVEPGPVAVSVTVSVTYRVE